MAVFLAAGAAALAGTYLLAAPPANNDENAAIPDNHTPTKYGQGIWKPENTGVFLGHGVSEAVVSNADPDVLKGGPDKTGDSKADPKTIEKRFNALHRRNEVAQQTSTSQLFNPYFLQRYNNTGNQSPLIMAHLSNQGSVTPYETVLDKSPFVLKGFQPIRERNELTDYGPTVTRHEHPAVKRDDYPSAVQKPPVRPASKGPIVATFGGIRKKRAKDLVTVNRKLIVPS